jgi:cobalt-zinc-cadmium efflux system membrane fusion protein
MRPRSARVYLLFLTLLPMLSCNRGGGKSEEEKEPAKKEDKKEDKAEKGDGLISLKPEEVQASGIATTAAAETTVADTVAIQGRVVPRSGQSAQVVPSFPGRLTAVAGGFPSMGNHVKEGQVLADVVQQLSASEATSIAEKQIDLQSQIKQTESELRQKTRDYERAQTLHQGGVIALKQLQQAETDVAVARSRHEMAVQALARYDALQSGAGSSPRRTPLRAPISGTVTVVNGAPNQQVDAAKPVFEIMNLDAVWVEAQVFEDQLPAVRRARTAELTARAAPDAVFKGKLVSLSQQMDPASKTQGVVFETPNPGGVLAVGMNVEVRVPSGTVSKGVAIPSSAVLEQQGHSIVFVERRANGFEKREVKLARPQGDKAIVISGLAAGDKVVTSGAQSVAAAAEPHEHEEEKEKEKH